MGTRLFGCFTVIGGGILIWASFHADELGLGEYKGVGEGDILMTVLGFLCAGIGILITFAPRDPRR